MNIDCRLATYGSLAPGRPNHHHVSMIDGKWSIGKVRGRLVARGWGADLGYPALVAGEDGDEIKVYLFEAIDLPAHWARLDEFEGSEYKRTRIQVETADGTVDAWIYLDSAGE